MELLDLMITGLVIWAAYKFIKYYLIAEVASNIPIEFVFPVRLEYNSTQWFAWDNDNEFLGQAPTKQELLEFMAQDLDFPKDKFQITYEGPLTPLDEKKVEKAVV